MPKKYRIELSTEEREELTALSCQERAAAYQVSKARMINCQPALSRMNMQPPTSKSEHAAGRACVRVRRARAIKMLGKLRNYKVYDVGS